MEELHRPRSTRKIAVRALEREMKRSAGSRISYSPSWNEVRVAPTP
jgi:hypothetical protein